MSDSVRKEIIGIFNTKTLTEQKRGYKRFEKKFISGKKGTHVRSNLIQKIIMDCRTPRSIKFK